MNIHRNWFNRRRRPIRQSRNEEERRKEFCKKIQNYTTLITLIGAVVGGLVGAFWSYYQFKKSVEISSQTLEQTLNQLKLANDQFLYQRAKDSTDLAAQKINDSVDKTNEEEDRLIEAETRNAARIHDSITDHNSYVRFEKQMQFQQNLVDEQNRATKAFEASSEPVISIKLSLELKDTLNKKFLICNKIIGNASIKPARILSGLTIFFTNKLDILSTSTLPTTFEALSMMNPLTTKETVSQVSFNSEIKPVYAVIILTYNEPSKPKEKKVEQFFFISKAFNSTDVNIPIYPLPFEGKRNEIIDVIEKWNPNEEKKNSERLLPFD